MSFYDSINRTINITSIYEIETLVFLLHGPPDLIDQISVHWLFEVAATENRFAAHVSRMDLFTDVFEEIESWLCVDCELTALDTILLCVTD